jgi:hypothetical protein
MSAAALLDTLDDGMWRLLENEKTKCNGVHGVYPVD